MCREPFRTFLSLTLWAARAERNNCLRVSLLGGLERFGFECRMSNRHRRSVSIACGIHLGVKLLRQRLHKTGAQPAFLLTCSQVLIADPIIVTRQLPVGI